MKTANSSSHQTNLNCKNVTQQIQVEKQVFHCIINLNTTAHTKTKHRKCDKKHRSKNSEEDRHNQPEEECWNKNSAKKKCKRKEKGVNIKKNKHRNKEQQFKHPYPDRSVIERIVPCCSRSACLYYSEYRKTYRKKIHENFRTKCESKDEVKHKKVKVQKHHHHHSHHNRHHDNRQSKPIKQTESRLLLSPISPSPLRDVADTALDDISNTSLNAYIKEKPTTYKGHVSTVTRETKLDTLIKRTKERERKLVEQSRQNHKTWYTSTPNYSTDFVMSGSDMDISFNSLSTLVLETNTAYSPINLFKDLQNPNEDIKNPNKDLQNQNEDIKNPNKNLLKSNKDLQNPNKDSYIIAKEIKREIILKSEPMFYCESPVYYENKDNMKFCKIENVKSEFGC